jgi:hypothetical protein
MFFDGVDDYMYIPDKGGSLTSFTLMLTSVTGFGVRDPYGGYFSVNRYHFEMSISPSRNSFSIRYYDVNGYPQSFTLAYPRDLAVLPAPTDIIFVVNSLFNYKLIIGGVSYSGGFAYTPKAPTLSLYIPRYADRLFPEQILIPCVLYYSIPLTDAQINQIIANPDNPMRNGLIAWFKADPQYVKDIDNDGVLEWVDLSGYGNHGKIYGAQLVQLVKASARALTPARVLSPAR